MVNQRKSLFAIGIVASGIFLGGCSSSTTISVPIVHPAELGLSSYKRIYIADFKNLSLAPNLQERIAYRLESAIGSTGRFDLIDKDVFGRFSGSETGALHDMFVIAGTISAYKPEHDMIRGDPYKVAVSESKSKSGHESKHDSIIHVDFTRRLRVHYAVQFRITDASDGRILATPMVERTYADSRTATDEEPPRFDLESITRKLEEEIVHEFVRKIVPHRELIRVSFLTSDDIPELEQGINAASSGDWDRSIRHFQSATEHHVGKPGDILARAYYDLGLALEFDHRYPEARTAFDRARNLDPGTEVYERAIAVCNGRESEWKRLLDQHWD